MRIKDMFPIMEAPLPDSWDKNIFKGDDFDTMLNYAKWQADRIGTGSARVQFSIKYKGRDTVLKIANSRGKGTQQNMQEQNLLSLPRVTKFGITIPLIDYDTESGGHPTWIHTELAKATSLKGLYAHFNGESIYDVVVMQRENSPNANVMGNINYQKLVGLISSNPLIDATDLATPENWGIYKGKPVIIDLGLSTEVRKLHYRN